MFITQSRKEILQSAKQHYEKGNPVGLLEAISFCLDRDDMPPWVYEGLALALKHFAKTYKFKKCSDGKSFKQQKADFADYRSYRAVQEAMKAGFKGGSQFEEAMNLLAKNWNIHRTSSTIETAYKKVQSALKTDVGRLQYAALMSAANPFLMGLLFA